MAFKGHVVLVTGAGGGIGEAIAEKCVKEGAKTLAVTDINGNAAQSVAARLTSVKEYSHCSIVSHRLDVASEESIAEVYKQVEIISGPIDVLVSNAGLGFGDPVVTDTTSQANVHWETQWKVNTFAHVLLMRPLVAGWMERGFGRLIVTASAAGLLVSPGDTAYAVTKAGAVAFAQQVAMIHGSRGLHVHCICPQAVQTSMLERGMQSKMAGLSLADGVVTASDVADELTEAVKQDRFYVFPHERVPGYMAFRGTQPEKWIKGVQKNVGKMMAKL